MCRSRTGRRTLHRGVFEHGVHGRAAHPGRSRRRRPGRRPFSVLSPNRVAASQSARVTSSRSPARVPCPGSSIARTTKQRVRERIGQVAHRELRVGQPVQEENAAARACSLAADGQPPAGARSNEAAASAGHARCGSKYNLWRSSRSAFAARSPRNAITAGLEPHTLTGGLSSHAGGEFFEMAHRRVFRSARRRWPATTSPSADPRC